MAIRERSFKYLDAQQESQQISVFFKSKFHNEGGVCEKSYFEVFFCQWSHLSFQKFQPSQTPSSHFLPIFPRFLTNIRCQYFSLNIWVVYDQLELDWCIFDQNWAKTRPLHFQIFQILNAIDRRIVQWGAILQWKFLERVALVGCNSFYTLVPRIGGTVWQVKRTSPKKYSFDVSGHTSWNMQKRKHSGMLHLEKFVLEEWYIM